MTKKGGTGKDKNKWLYLVAVIGQAFAGDEDVKLFEEFFSATIAASIGNAATRRVGNNSKACNSNSDSDSNSNSSSNQKSTVTKKRGGKVTSASGGGGSADDSYGSFSTVCSAATADLSEIDDDNDSEYDEDPIMECNLVDEAAVVEIKEVEDGKETILVGPKTSTIKREWNYCKSVLYDPSTQGDRRFKDVCRVNWNGTELQTPQISRTPLFYFKKSFPMDYLQKIEEFTNIELGHIYQNTTS